jgi:hypothetical protein
MDIERGSKDSFVASMKVIGATKEPVEQLLSADYAVRALLRNKSNPLCNGHVVLVNLIKPVPGSGVDVIVVRDKGRDWRNALWHSAHIGSILNRSALPRRKLGGSTLELSLSSLLRTCTLGFGSSEKEVWHGRDNESGEEG